MNKLTEGELTSFSRFRVTSADTDMYSRIRPGALVNLLIQSAIDSADSLGFGYGGIRGQNLFWVLSRLTLEIYRPLLWKEIAEVETWPKNIAKLLYLRDFVLRDKDRNVTAKATSGWLAVDIETKRIKRIEGIDKNYFKRLKGKHALTEPPVKLPPVNDGDIFDLTAKYCDIDLNKHVTTTRYVDWIMDSFSPEFHRENYPEKLSLNLMKETMAGETIRLLKKCNSNLWCSFDGIKTESNTSAFRAGIKF